MQFSTFLVTVVEISNKHFCKLDKILRNFPSWQNFVFVTVYEIFGFEFCHFMLWGCDILERYCTVLWLRNRPPMRWTSLSTNYNCLFTLIFNSDWRIKWNLRRRKNTSAIFPVFGKFLKYFFENFSFIEFCRLYRIHWYIFCSENILNEKIFAVFRRETFISYLYTCKSTKFYLSSMILRKRLIIFEIEKYP